MKAVGTDATRAIHKRLWEVAAQAEDLAQAIRAYARGYFIKNDYYNGINFALLLNVRAAQSGGDEAIADRVLARRVRREVLLLCDTALASGTLKADELFWVGATKVEALFGLGLKADSDQLKQQLLSGPLPMVEPAIRTVVELPSVRTVGAKEAYVPPAAWMIDSMNDQLGKLAALEP